MFFFFQAEDGIRDKLVTGVQTCALPIYFQVSQAELFEPAAAAENAPPKNLFVFDDQTHIVRSSTNNPQGLRALAQGPGAASTAAGFTPALVPPFGNPNNGRGGNPAGVDELGGT